VKEKEKKKKRKRKKEKQYRDSPLYPPHKSIKKLLVKESFLQKLFFTKRKNIN